MSPMECWRLTLLRLSSQQVLQYTHSMKHIFPLFFANISTVIMFWTYIKALFRSILAKTRFGDIKFKTTLKVPLDIIIPISPPA